MNGLDTGSYTCCDGSRGRTAFVRLSIFTRINGVVRGRQEINEKLPERRAVQLDSVPVIGQKAERERREILFYFRENEKEDAPH